MDLDIVWSSLGGGAAVAGVLALARLLVEHVERRGQRALDSEQRRRAHEWDADARLQRVLSDQLAEAERRCERCAAALERERARGEELERAARRLEHTEALLGGRGDILPSGEATDDDWRLLPADGGGMGTGGGRGLLATGAGQGLRGPRVRQEPPRPAEAPSRQAGWGGGLGWRGPGLPLPTWRQPRVFGQRLPRRGVVGTPPKLVESRPSLSPASQREQALRRRYIRLWRAYARLLARRRARRDGPPPATGLAGPDP